MTSPQHKAGDGRGFHPMRLVTLVPTENDVCDRCGDGPVRDVLDGDFLCQSCCEAWARSEGEALQEQMRGAGLYRGVEIEARLAMLDGGLRRYDRLERRAGGRVK